MFKLTFSELWKFTKGLQKYGEHLLKKNGLNLIRNTLCSILIDPTLIFLSPVLPQPWKLTALQPQLVAVKISSLAGTEGCKWVWCSLKAPITRELALFDLSDSSLEKSHSQGLSFWSDSKLLVRTILSQGICQKQSVAIF